MFIRSTGLLRAAVLFMGLFVLLLCFLALPAIIKDALGFFPPSVIYPLGAGLYLTTLPFFGALGQAWKLLRLIDKGEAFTGASVKALRAIRNLAGVITIIYTLCLPLFYLMAEFDDAPGFVIIGLLPTFAAFVVAVFAAVLEKLLQEALQIKSDLDLTI